jgi:hypothetical protein
MKKVYNIILLFSLVTILGACKKEGPEKILSSEAEILAFALTEQVANTEIIETTRTVNITFTPDVTEAAGLGFELLLSEGAVARIGTTTIQDGLSAYSFEAPFNIDVTAEDRVTTKTYKVVPNNSSIDPNWQLGGFQKLSEANNRDYNWYLDQSITGTYSSINCGPTSTTMAAKWFNENFNLTPEDARSAYRPEGGWWYTSDIDHYLTDNSINHHFIALSNSYSGTANILKQTVDNGNIAILCLDMYYIRNAANGSSHADKFYSTSAADWGHFIVVKGYKEVDNQYLFEIYDPYCYSRNYTDGSPKGRDRYYRAKDLYDATSIWWNYSIVVTPPGRKSVPDNALDPATVPEGMGR